MKHNLTRFVGLVNRSTAFISAGAIIFTVFAPFSIPVANAADSGFQSPTATHTINGWVNATNAFSDNDQYAVSGSFGTGTAGTNVQGYASFGFAPTGVPIQGIEVQAAAKTTDTSGCELQVSLSGDNGVNYSSPKSALLSATESIVSFGGASDLWGGAWDSTKVDNGSFVVRVSLGSGCASGAGVVSLDHLQVKLHYTGSITQTPNPTLANSCGLDVVLVADVSSSIDASEYALMQSAMGTFATALDATPTNFAVVAFDSSATAVAPANAFTQNGSAVADALNPRPAPSGSGGTNWEAGLLAAQTLLPGGSKPNVIVFASDGQPTVSNGPLGHLEDAKIVADDIKDGGTRIIAVGIGTGDSPEFVGNLKVVSGPNVDTGGVDSDVITSDFDTLASDLAALAQELCGGTVTVHKVMDADGNLATTNDQTPGVDWKFNINGSTYSTDENGQAVSTHLGTGTYSVIETPQEGYSLKGAVCTGATDNGSFNTSGISGLQIQDINIISCTFYNSLTPETTLTILKEVVNTNGGTKVVADFPLFIDAMSVISGALNSVTPGTHTISETNQVGYTGTIGGDCAVDGTITIAEGESKTCTITNDDNTPSLTLTKSVVHTSGGTADASEWTLTADGPTGFSGEGPSVSSDGSFKAGTYTLSEEGPDGYNASDWTCVGGTQNGSSITLALGESATCSITNTEKVPGVLRVIKRVINDGPEGYTGTASADDFEITVTGGNATPDSFPGSELGTDVTIDAGASYSVSETDGPTGDYVMTLEGSCSGTMPEGGQATCTVINNDNPPTTGRLIVTKTVVNDNGGTAEANDWTMNVTAIDPSDASFPGGENVEVRIGAGSYSVDESGGPTGYVKTLGIGCSGTIALGETKTCTITNDDQPATLMIIKNVVNQDGGSAVAADFMIRVEEEGGDEVGGSPQAGSTTGTEYVLNLGDYVVSENEDPHYVGDFSACSGGTISLTASVICTITNTFRNSVPVANDDAYPTDEDTVLTIPAPGVLENDTDGEDDSLLAGLVETTEHGILVLNPDGSFSYTPEANFTGTDTFTYQANDLWGNSETATVTITVNPVNDAPVANNDSHNTDEDTPLSVSVGDGVLSNDTDVENDPLTASLVDDVDSGVLTLNPDGSFTYQPNAGFNGTDTFTYKANDGSADSQTAMVTIEVGSVNDVPEATNDSYETDEDTVLETVAPGVLANDDDADEGSALTAELDTDVAHGELTLNDDGSFTYTPDADFNGVDSFTYHANDGDADSSTVTVTITVNPVNDAPVASNETLSTEQNLPVADMLDATDIDGDDLTFDIVTDALNGVLSFFDADTGAFTYQPNNNFVGDDTFTFTAEDGSLTSNEATVTIHVSESPEDTVPLCSDGQDNDNDDLIDLEDPDCDDFIPRLTLVKEVENSEESPSLWTLTASSTDVGISGVTDSEDVTDVQVDPGTYTLSESGGPDRFAASAWNCIKNDAEVGVNGSTVTLAIGDEAICTIINTFTPFSSDVSLTKTVDDATPDVGQSITYTLTVSNAGPDVAENVVVTDTLPESLTYVSDDGSGAFATSTGWTIGTLAHGESKVLHLVVTVNSGTEGQTIVNTASVTNDHADPNPENNTPTVPVTVNTPAPGPESPGPTGGGCRRGTVRDPITRECVPDTPPQVLGVATTTPRVLGVSCGLYMDQYLKRSLPNKNNPDQVTKLQVFLNKWGYGTFTPTGFFGPLTEAAVKAFQAKYSNEILVPWGIQSPTGLAYLTTIRQLNIIECPELMIPVPTLIDWNKNPNVQ